MEHLSNDHEERPNQHKLCDETGASCCEFDEKSMETETKKWSKFLNGGKAIVEQILAAEEKNKSKTAGLWE